MANNLFRNRFPFVKAVYNSYENKERYEEQLARHTNFLTEINKAFPQALGYLNSNFHDSLVQSLNVQEKAFTIGLNDISTTDFVLTVKEVIGLKDEKKALICPVYFEFSAVKHCSLYWINRNGKLLQLGIEKHFHRVFYFLWNEVLTLEPDAVSIAMLFETRTMSRKSPLVLHIEADKLEIRDKRRSAVLSAIGDTYAEIFDAYWDARQNGEDFSLEELRRFIQ